MFSNNKSENPPNDTSADQINKAAEDFNHITSAECLARKMRNLRLRRALRGLQK